MEFITNYAINSDLVLTDEAENIDDFIDDASRLIE